MEELIQNLTEYTRVTGGHERRTYLGLSQISKSENELLEELIDGTHKPDDDGVMLMALGYVVEADIRRRLEGIKVALPNTQYEIVASYDPRVKGHIDGLTNIPGQIYEIKSTKQEKLDFIKNSGKLPTKDFLQVQGYLHHGKYKSCLVVYVARDSGKIWAKELWYMSSIGRMLEEKIKKVLHMYDATVTKMEIVK